MWWDSDGVVTVVERCPGGTLESYVAENGRRLAVPCTMGIMTQILDALGDIHETDVTYQHAEIKHRLLEPGVILLADMQTPAVKCAPLFYQGRSVSPSLEKRLAPNPMVAIFTTILRFLLAALVGDGAPASRSGGRLVARSLLALFHADSQSPRYPIQALQKLGRACDLGSVILSRALRYKCRNHLKNLTSMLSPKCEGDAFHTAAAFKEALEGAVCFNTEYALAQDYSPLSGTVKKKKRE
jgi:serine/threonine protein kinase